MRVPLSRNLPKAARSRTIKPPTRLDRSRGRPSAPTPIAARATVTFARTFSEKFETKKKKKRGSFFFLPTYSCKYRRKFCKVEPHFSKQTPTHSVDFPIDSSATVTSNSNVEEPQKNTKTPTIALLGNKSAPPAAQHSLEVFRQWLKKKKKTRTFCGLGGPPT